MDNAKQAYESHARSIEGAILRDVAYVVTSDNLETWSMGDVHCLEFGLDLALDRGILGVTWDSALYQYGLALLDSTVSGTVLEPLRVPVGDSPPWRQLIGHTIAAVRVFWGRVDEPSGAPSREYPQDLEIVFEHGERVYFTAAKCLDGGRRLFGMADEIAVLTESAARRLRIGPFSPLA